MYLNFLLKYKIQIEKSEKLSTLKYEAPNFVETTQRLDPHHSYIMGEEHGCMIEDIRANLI